ARVALDERVRWRCGHAQHHCCWNAIVASNAISSAAGINVPTDQPTIQAGINAALPGDTVLVGPGTYTEAILITGKSITVASSDGAKATVIDATGLFMSTVRFEGGLTNGSV